MFGVKKVKSLVNQAFMQSNHCLKDIEIFHSDRGNEFNNKMIDKLLLAFNINRSLNKKADLMIMLLLKQLSKLLRQNLLMIEILHH
ncbi:hypothetical protein [Spiroplasma ixodetis]|uniref:hypothetical protein n=1 Tax=Spiroplasma ixodetis TaxID=2141 RepID=UPI002576258D|nr:hypothetical protein [Spiroplasma ixodetis]